MQFRQMVASLFIEKSKMADDASLWRMNLSDGEEKQLTKGVDVHPTVSPDGKWVVFTRFGERTSLWKVPIDGGEPTQVLDNAGLNPAVSPDGKMIAITYSGIALVPFEGGKMVKNFNVKYQIPPASSMIKLQWTADGQGIYFIALNKGVSNIWRQPVDGSAPMQVTDFKEGRIFNFAFSAKGSQLALSRGTFNSDVVLIENQK
jgi:Tol biopolymer transport system component